MTPDTPGYKPLQDCCCLATPPVLRRHVASMAFNFSAVPEKAPLPPQRGVRSAQQTSSVQRVFNLFSLPELFPAR